MLSFVSDVRRSAALITFTGVLLAIKYVARGPSRKTDNRVAIEQNRCANPRGTTENGLLSGCIAAGCNEAKYGERRQLFRCSHPENPCPFLVPVARIKP
ncbi:MAG: hypothetical protein KUG70_12690 [Rhodobacteraceae bacterium]|nr:hypothetical protein [Paracoccaceae bacterium]